MSFVKLSTRAATVLVAFVSLAAVAADASSGKGALKGGSEYEKGLQQSGMSGMTGMSGDHSSTTKTDEKKKVTKKKAKKAEPAPKKDAS